MKYKKVVFLIKEALHVYPPCVSQIYMLNDENVDVTVICGECDPSLLLELERRNIKCTVLGNKRLPGKQFGKIANYIKFRNKANNILKSLDKDNTIVWLGTADTAIALVGELKRYNYVLSILELYDKYPFYQWGLKKVVNEATAIIAVEETRSQIMKTWWNLKVKPFVMPNKPYSHPQKKNQSSLNEDVQNAISQLTERKIILYQGIISADRDLTVLAGALKKMKSEYTLVLMGSEYYDGVKEVKELYNKTLYLGYFPAPSHLDITSHASIGVANYDDSSLNNIFCAPNKIYEYSGFNIPILGSEVAGLHNTIGKFSAGELVDFSNENSIIKGIRKIEENYDIYSRNSLEMFNSIDNTETLKQILFQINKEI